MATGNGKISELENIGEITDETMFEVVDVDKNENGLDNYQSSAFQIETYINREDGAVKTRITGAVEAEKNRAKNKEHALFVRQNNLEQAIANEENRARGVEGDIENLETVDKSNLVAAINTVKRGGNANAQEITKLQTAVSDLKDYADEQIADTVAGTQHFFPAVDTIAQLPEVEDTSKNHLCRVRGEQAVYQCVAGQTEWNLYSDSNDFVNELELADAITEHDEDPAAHEDIRTAVSDEATARHTADQTLQQAIATETQNRQQADTHLQEQIDQLDPENISAALEEIEGQLSQKAPINATLTDAEASNTLPSTASSPITTILQVMRNNLKHLFANKASINSPTFTGTPRVPASFQLPPAPDYTSEYETEYGYNSLGQPAYRKRLVCTSNYDAYNTRIATWGDLYKSVYGDLPAIPPGDWSEWTKIA